MGRSRVFIGPKAVAENRAQGRGLGDSSYLELREGAGLLAVVAEYGRSGFLVLLQHSFYESQPSASACHFARFFL